ncbi:hypothetical protein HU200_048819 [Digitaria exilis]|uniref:Disease resistance R13L4/SHOC-2-like LRR domain-containing protein n=1 Tax=Digitaria exilis TaxID=1010633 RepID=A0A835ARL1_9POAL|nr:hypothetical protein HU200_048819 [Digitaria exilis]
MSGWGLDLGGGWRCPKGLSSQLVAYDEEMVPWLEELAKTASAVFPNVLDQADPQRQNTLLPRAAQCFHRRRRYSSRFLCQVVKDVYGFTESSYLYGHVSTAIVSRLRLPPVGLEQSPHPSYGDFTYEIYLQTLCMNMFPYGHKFEKDRLVQKLSCETGWNLDSAENELHCFFYDLVRWGAVTNEAANSRISDADEAVAWQWNISRLEHQFLGSKSAEMVGIAFTSHTLKLLAAASTTNHGKQPSKTPRRLALHHNDPHLPSLLQNVDLSLTRSLAVFGGVVSRSVPLDRFLNLVVLDVEGWENFGDEDLLQISRSKMFFMVYLSFRSTRVSKLPPEIKELCNLAVLDAMIEWFKSDETATRLPHDIRHLLKLRTLTTVDLREQPISFINALGDLWCLSVLAITWSFHQSCDSDYCEALLSSIKKWHYLKFLTIHCGLGCSMEFLGSLSSPPRWLEKFKATTGRFACVPQWFHGLECLSFVQITVCKLEAHDLEILRDLYSLKCLVLGLDFIPKEAIVIKNEGFRALQRFSIECPVPWLTFESRAMPMLKYLQLDFHACPTSPASVPMGISNLCSLAEVALWYNVRYANSSSIKSTVKAVRDEVAECHSATATQMLRLLVNGIEQDDIQAVDEETQGATGPPTGTSAGVEDAVQEADEIMEA